MPNDEKTYLLKQTPEGMELHEFEEADATVEDGRSESLDLSAICEPRWHHWYQRKLARPWQATLLGMNIEPIPEARRLLREFDTGRYQMFKDRLDILQTLIGYEIHYWSDHVREAKGPNGKYIELTEYCKYAESLDWTGLEPMRGGLKLDSNPPVIRHSQRQTDNVLLVLDTVFLCAVPNYMKNHKRSPAAVIKWLSAQGQKTLVAENTLRNWFIQIDGLQTSMDELDSAKNPH